jgi:hypothetical protein
MDWECSSDDGDKKYIRNYVVKLPRKCPLERPGMRWEDNINMDLRKTGCEDGR